MMKRVSFLIDGFNLYHSLREIGRLTKAPVKWLDIVKLCEAYLHAVRSGVGERVELASVTYFSAFATHLVPSNPDVVKRHQTYVAALESTGVEVVLARFKEKTITCPVCGNRIKRHEEKETDVALGLRLIEVLSNGSCDTAVSRHGGHGPCAGNPNRKANAPRTRCRCGVPIHATQCGAPRGGRLLVQHQPARCQRAQLPLQIQVGGQVLTKPPAW